MNVLHILLFKEKAATGIGSGLFWSAQYEYTVISNVMSYSKPERITLTIEAR